MSRDGWYPPGVTGNEPEIVGYPEGLERVTCRGVVPGQRVQIVFRAAETGEEMRVDAPDVGIDEIDCPAGTDWVDGQYDPRSQTFHYTCPICGTGGEIDIER